ncbi:MAG: hypothetical protein K5695_14875 [Oscillospiraceae bacterium]|nr:hypothetical protein [Oscillospiraceae bacterium]
MKKAILPTILLCAYTLTGCFYDDDFVDSEPSAVSLTTIAETTQATEFIPTKGTAEATETCSDPVPMVAVMDAESNETELICETEPTEQTEETTAETVTKMTEEESMAETESTETEQVTEPTESVAESENEPVTEQAIELTTEQSDYDKAVEVYEHMLENGHGTCVNYACQTYENCLEIGLPCYIVWTDAELGGHVANAVQVDGIWFILDTQGGYFLTYNYGFTEVIDMEMNHIGDASMLSNRRYDELFG